MCQDFFTTAGITISRSNCYFVPNFGFLFNSECVQFSKMFFFNTGQKIVFVNSVV